jgi:hypothetical protein
MSLPSEELTDLINIDKGQLDLSTFDYRKRSPFKIGRNNLNLESMNTITHPEQWDRYRT